MWLESDKPYSQQRSSFSSVLENSKKLYKRVAQGTIYLGALAGVGYISHEVALSFPRIQSMLKELADKAFASLSERFVYPERSHFGSNDLLVCTICGLFLTIITRKYIVIEPPHQVNLAQLPKLLENHTTALKGAITCCNFSHLVDNKKDPRLQALLEEMNELRALIDNPASSNPNRIKARILIAAKQQVNAAGHYLHLHSPLPYSLKTAVYLPIYPNVPEEKR